MSREIKLDEIKGHNNEDSAWVIIHNDVYDLTKFLEEHPGGVESILEYAGKDGTQAFEDVAHSQDARELMVKFKIGTLPEDQRIDTKCSLPQLDKDVVVYAATSSPYDREVVKYDPQDWRAKEAKNARPTSANPNWDSTLPAELQERCHDYTYKSNYASGSGLKWTLVALAGAIVIGIALHRCMNMK